MPKSCFFHNRHATRIVLIVLWTATFGLLAFGGYPEMKSAWPYVGIALALACLIGLPYLRHVPVIQRFLPVVLPAFLIMGIIGNICYATTFVDKNRLYNRITEDRLLYWFNQYKVKMEHPHFYLKMRKFMAGNSLVCRNEAPIREYGALNISQLKDLTVKNYDSTVIGTKTFQLLRQHPELTGKQLTMFNVQKENEKRKVNPVPFFFFLPKNAQSATYYLHQMQLKFRDNRLEGYIAIPESLHEKILSSRSS